MKRILSLLLALALCLPLCACGKTEATKAAENAIASIGEVSLDSFDAITQAQKLYDLLTDDEKSKVKNREVLVDALDAYSNAVYTQNIEELKGVYAALKDAYTIVDHYGADIYLCQIDYGDPDALSQIPVLGAFHGIFVPMLSTVNN